MKMPQMIAATKITNTTMKKMFAPHFRPGSMNVEKNLSAEVTFSVGVAVFDVVRLMMAEPSSRSRVCESADGKMQCKSHGLPE